MYLQLIVHVASFESWWQAFSIIFNYELTLNSISFPPWSYSHICNVHVVISLIFLFSPSTCTFLLSCSELGSILFFLALDFYHLHILPKNIIFQSFFLLSIQITVFLLSKIEAFVWPKNFDLFELTYYLGFSWLPCGSTGVMEEEPELSDCWAD